MASDEDTPDVRKGQGKVELSREEFRRRLGERFYDPAFDAVRPEIERVIEVAWDGYQRYRKSPRKRKTGPGFADPEFELPIEWLETRDRILAAERRQKDPSAPRRVLVVAAAARHDQTCPGEMSKTLRLARLSPTGCATWTSFQRARTRRSTATSATTSRTRPATRPWTATKPSRKQPATWTLAERSFARSDTSPSEKRFVSEMTLTRVRDTPLALEEDR